MKGIERRRKRGSIVIDLEGKAILPGFVDAHSHFPGSGLVAVAVDVNSPPIGKTKNIVQLIEAIKNKAGKTPKGKWILAFGYDDTMLEDMRHPTRLDLDKASSDHPIVVAHISWHVVAVNSLALEELGIGKTTKNSEGGVVRKIPCSPENG